MKFGVAPVGSLWLQFGMLCFLLSGFFSDLLAIRLFLVMANACMLLNAVVGWPFWPDLFHVTPVDYIAVDTVVWSLLSLYVHGSALVKLILDEKPVELTDDEEALWRMFYRRSGLTRMVFKQYLSPQCKVKDFSAGHVIPGNVEGEKHLFIVLDGSVQGRVTAYGKQINLTFYSGELFDIKYLNVLGINVGFLDQTLVCTAKTDVRLFCFPVRTLETLAQGSSLARSAWHSLVVSALARIAERPWTQDFADGSTQMTRRQNEGRYNEHRRDEIFAPLRTEEYMNPALPGSGNCWRNPFSNLLFIIASSFSLPWPCSNWIYGLRHSMMTPPNSVKLHDIRIQPVETDPLVLHK